MSEKPESSVQDQQSNNTVAGIPIKKRLLAWTKSSSPPSGVLSCKTEGSGSSTKKHILTETDPTQVKKARKHSIEPAIDIRPVPPGCQHEAVGKEGLNLVLGHDKEAGKIDKPTIDNRSMFPQGLPSEFRVPPHLSAGEKSTEDKVILNSKSALPGACKVEEPATGNTSMPPQELLSKVRASSYLPAVKENAEGKIIPNSDSTWQGASKITISTGTSLGHPLMENGVTPPSTVLSGLFNDGRHLDGISVKVEKMDSCSNTLPLVGQYSQLKKQKNRLNWDLNTVMEAWEGSSGESTMNHEDANDLGLVDKCSLAGVHVEPNRTDLTVGQSSTLDTDHNPNLSTLSLSTSEHFSSHAGLDLQLRPPCKANLGLNLGVVSSHLAELNSIPEMSELSLSLSGNVDFDTSGSGKPKYFDEKSQNTTKEVNLSSTKIIGSRPVKCEPCDGKFYEAPNSASSSNMQSATSSNSKITSVSVVKPEPREVPSQQCREEPAQLLSGEFDKNNFVSSGTCVAENAKVMDLFSDHAKIGLVSGISTSADNTSSVTTGVVGTDMNLPSQSLSPDCGTAHYSEGVQNNANESCSENSTYGEASCNLLESAVAQGKDVNAACEAFELAAVTSSLPVEHVGSDDKGSITTNDLSSVIGTTGSNDEKLATHETSVIENNEKKNSSYQFDKSSHFTITETDEHERKTHQSGDVDGIKRSAPKEGERGDDFEDGEVRDPILHAEGGDRVLPDVPLKIPLDEGVSEIKVENPEESKIVDDSLCADERDSCISTADNQQEVSAVGCLNVTTSKKQVTKTTQKFTVNNMVNEKGCETKSNPKRDALARNDKGGNDKSSSTPENSKGLDMIPEKHLPIKDASLNVNLGKQESGKEKQSRIIKLTSATEKSSYGKVKSNDNKSPLMQSEEDKMTDRPFMRNKPYFRETRDGFCKDRYQKFTSDRSQDQYSGKHRSDLIRMTERGNTHPDGSHVFPRFKKSTGMRYPRHNNSSEIAYIPPDCMVARKHGEDESSNLSRLSSRRRSPGPVDREVHPVMGVQVAGRSFISPSRCIARDISDSLPLNADDKRLRGLPDVMGDLSLRSQHRLQFEREENAYIRRVRRSSSPRPRRGIPMRFRNECSPHQWSPPRRSPNIYEGHPELGHIRSPPILTHDRMRSPRQRPCFPEDVIVRRPGSPQSFMTRMSDDAREIHLRRNDCMRPERVLERNMQRFDMIDPRETTEEEYLEHLHYNHFCEERRFVRPIRQRFNASEDEGSLHNHAGDGPPTFRFRPEAMEGFSERGGSRDFNGHIQSRPGNVHDRLHGIDEREQYHGRQGWSEADFAGVRPKRRRM
ncbi:hypothetical protein IHE45_07G118300 [Dioscorea alata]|uniref:Uncharacterized protein n=1 Tax=Dioscorea alata TaxID=55571 RepID=A0ACB7VU26_DIOAL|nr:hypothetical protein IHE45_07G118300 [Dioscorea alata]